MTYEEFDQYILILLNVRYQGKQLSGQLKEQIKHTIIAEAVTHVPDFDPLDSPYVVVFKGSNITIFRHLPGVIAPICITGEFK